MIRLSAGITDLADPNSLRAPLPDFVLVDLDTSALNVFNLVKIINGAGPATKWIYYGSTAKVDTIAKLVTPSYAHLESPLNPLRILSLMNRVLRGKQKNSTTVSG